MNDVEAAVGVYDVVGFDTVLDDVVGVRVSIAAGVIGVSVGVDMVVGVSAVVGLML